MQLIEAIIFIIKCEYLLFKVRKNGSYLKKIKYDDWTFDICLTAVKQNGLMLETISSQKYKFTHKDYEMLCIEAIKQNEHAFQYVISPTEQVCIDAITKNESIYYLYPHQRKHFNYVVLQYILQNTSLEILINIDEDKLINSVEIINLLLNAPKDNKRNITIKKGNVSTVAEIIKI